MSEAPPDARPSRGSDGSAFDAVDTDLTIFALANGMDLEREEGSRTLLWFRDGLDRRMVLTAGPDGHVEMSAAAELRRKGVHRSAERPLEDGIDPTTLEERLREILARGQEAADAIGEDDLS